MNWWNAMCNGQWRNECGRGLMPAVGRRIAMWIPCNLLMVCFQEHGSVETELGGGRRGGGPRGGVPGGADYGRCSGGRDV